jgi:hypothetical protein
VLTDDRRFDSNLWVTQHPLFLFFYTEVTSGDINVVAHPRVSKNKNIQYATRDARGCITALAPLLTSRYVLYITPSVKEVVDVV